MNNREMLEFAAKAAGLKPFTVWGKTFVKGDGSPPKLYWNPLTDDGDALRLAVVLGLYVSPAYKNEPSVFVNEWHGQGACALETVGSDPYAATRLAITRVAAEIGKAMP